jgi:Skp family chaperone for outer membrane proteins
MSGELAGVADIVTGAAIGRAMEPEAGEGHGSHAEGNCLNCGTTRIGPHCHVCGQKGHVHRTLHAFGHDFMHSVLHFDGKIWRTLPMLFWKPGDLTRRYVHGERAKFVSPLALFLFTVFLTFAVFNWLVPEAASINPEVTVEVAQAQYQEDRKEILDDIAKLEADKQEAIADGAVIYEWMDGEISRKRERLKKLDEGQGKIVRTAELGARKIESEKSKLETDIAKLEAEIDAAQKAGKPTAALEERLEGDRMGLKLMSGAANAFVKGETSENEFRFTDLDFPGAKSLNKAVEKARDNPQLLLYKMQSNAYKFSWALIPISVPFVWLLFFWRRRFKMFDHAVFVTYSLTFMMLLGVICGILIQFPATEVIGGLALALLPPIHMYRQLHHAYETSRFGAFWRMCILSFFALTALTLFAVLIVTLGVTG